MPNQGPIYLVDLSTATKAAYLEVRVTKSLKSGSAMSYKGTRTHLG